ncbi:39S ribosomal protein L41, mitochondrial isoform X3 [Capsicum annuum]|uniref:39S ribosomal protein L41, mitochondrial isoform X3 n=1 Tax=Capsicum annuum TaxID=4072 RepID=UPI0007BEDB0F|nr:39S ribosomal protein L41, mitochondrial isoform X3 [Capsicum annuum]
MPLGLLLGLGRSFRRKRTSSLDILTTKRVPRGFYKGKNCKPTGFHTRKGGYVIVQEKLPNYVVPDLTSFKEFTFPLFSKNSDPCLCITGYYR